MRRAAALVLLSLACGCATRTVVSYQTAVVIAPAKEPGRYEVTAKIVRHVVRERSQLLWGGVSRKTAVLAAPTVTCEPGRRATCTVAASDGGGLRLEAYIARKDESKPTTCTLTIQQAGAVASSTSLRVPPLADPLPRGAAPRPPRGRG